MTWPSLVLASGSRYRREQLARLGLVAISDSPDIDESRLPAESPQQMALRLAHAKASCVGQRHGGALIIGADQVAVLDDRILGKPGSALAQQQQLIDCRGRLVAFHTALAVVDTRSQRCLEHLDLTRCQLRDLDDAAIARYVAAEPAYDCAGGFKVESRGIALFERIDSEDPSALIGLPLIALCRLLRAFGCALP